MIRALGLAACLVSAVALAQSAHDQFVEGEAAHERMHAHHMADEHHTGGVVPTQVGQDAFAAIQEIVGILEADPTTDWSKVDIDALRRHLVDMSNVILAADVSSAPMDGGLRFDVTGVGAVRDSVRRMVTAHATMMNGVEGWKFEASEIDGGAAMTVRAPAADANKLRGLGFFGLMTRGMHHRYHHLMIARGEHPHG